MKRQQNQPKIELYLLPNNVKMVHKYEKQMITVSIFLLLFFFTQCPRKNKDQHRGSTTLEKRHPSREEPPIPYTKKE
jgi:hypothetical protein